LKIISLCLSQLSNVTVPHTQQVLKIKGKTGQLDPTRATLFLKPRLFLICSPLHDVHLQTIDRREKQQQETRNKKQE